MSGNAVYTGSRPLAGAEDPLALRELHQCPSAEDLAQRVSLHAESAIVLAVV